MGVIEQVSRFDPRSWRSCATSATGSTTTQVANSIRSLQRHGLADAAARSRHRRRRRSAP